MVEASQDFCCDSEDSGTNYSHDHVLSRRADAAEVPFSSLTDLNVIQILQLTTILRTSIYPSSLNFHSEVSPHNIIRNSKTKRKLAKYVAFTTLQIQKSRHTSSSPFSSQNTSIPLSKHRRPTPSPSPSSFSGVSRLSRLSTTTKTTHVQSEVKRHRCVE